MEKGSKVKYLGETNWAFTHGKIYKVEGYDRELDAWGIWAENNELYAVGEDDLEELKDLKFKGKVNPIISFAKMLQNIVKETNDTVSQWKRKNNVYYVGTQIV